MIARRARLSRAWRQCGGVASIARWVLDRVRASSTCDEIIDARVWAGIHFRAADVQAAGIGKDVAHWLGKYYFRPVH